MTKTTNALLYPYGPAQCKGLIKKFPLDFKVTEQLGFEASGEGEHLLLQVEKTALTTHQLIGEICRQLDITERQIGYSGLKDKQAVTRQWLSIQLPGYKHKPDFEESSNINILQSHWHDRKLRVGSHKSNRFEVTIRNITGDIDHLSTVSEQIKSSGFANYFGAQRFGMQQDNVDQALTVLNNRHKLKRLSRHKKSLYLSALRSELYNQLLQHRILKGIFKQPAEGDLWSLAGSQSVFDEPLNELIQRRYRDLDIHSSLSLFGCGESRLRDDALQLENDVLTANKELTDTLLGQKIKRSYRANRSQAKGLTVEYRPEKAEMTIQVELERGSFMTTFLNHFIETETI